MRKILSSLIAASLLGGPCCALADADGGQIRLSEQHGNHQITVFTSPTPLRAGPIDLSVLLQDTTTNQTISDASVTIELISANKSLPPIHAAATTAAATNKLLQAALVDLPAPGPWQVRVECIPATNQKPIVTAFTIEAAPPLPRWLSVWPWFTWPFAAVLIFAVHRTLVARRQSRRFLGGTPTQNLTPAIA